MKEKLKNYFNKDRIFIFVCVLLIAFITFLVVFFQHLDIEKMENKTADISVVQDDNNLYFNASSDIYDDLFVVTYSTLNTNNIYALTNDYYSSLDYSLFSSFELTFFTCNVEFIIDNLNAYYPNGNYPTYCYISVPCTILYAFNPLDYSFGYSIPYTYHYYNSNDNMLNSSYLLTYFNNWDVNDSAFLDDSISFDYQYSLQSIVGDSQNFTFYFPFSTQGLLNNSNIDYLVFYALNYIVYDDSDLFNIGFGSYNYYDLVFDSPSSLQNDYNSLVNQYNSYVNTHSYTNEQYNDYVDSHSYTNTQYNDLQNEYNDYVDSHSYTNTQYNNSYNDGYNDGYDYALNLLYKNNAFYNATLNYYMNLSINTPGYSVLITDNYLNGNQFIQPFNLLKSHYSSEDLRAYVENTNLSYFELVFDSSVPFSLLQFKYLCVLGNDFDYNVSFYCDDNYVWTYHNPQYISDNNDNPPYNDFLIDFNGSNLENRTIYKMTWRRQYSYEIGTISNDQFALGYSEGVNDTTIRLNDDIKALEDENKDLKYQISSLEDTLDDSLNTLAFTFISSVMSTPFNILHDYLNWNFFGINLFSLFTSLITLLLVIWIIKFLLGRK